MTESNRPKILKNFIPSKYDYNRMIAEECKGIDQNESYNDNQYPNR